MTEGKIISIILARVSTADQATIPIQIKEIEREATRRGEEIYKIIPETRSVKPKEDEINVLDYIDRIPALKEIVQLARQRKFNKLWVWRWDRLSRSVPFQSLIVDNILRQEKVIAESLMEGTNVFARHVASMVSEAESRIKSERVTATFKDMYERRSARHRPLFGYAIVKGKEYNTYEVVPEKAKIVQKFFRHFIKLKSIRKAWRASGLNQQMTVVHAKRILTNKTYIGLLQRYDCWKRGRHKSIIKRKDFLQVQEILASVCKEPRNPKYVARLIKEGKYNAGNTSNAKEETTLEGQ